MRYPCGLTLCLRSGPIAPYYARHKRNIMCIARPKCRQRVCVATSAWALYVQLRHAPCIKGKATYMMPAPLIIQPSSLSQHLHAQHTLCISHACIVCPAISAQRASRVAAAANIVVSAIQHQFVPGVQCCRIVDRRDARSLPPAFSFST